ncbi:MAG: hypothetical protein FJ388_19510 [Verrucomicrobia bacterium]|nr:hypothetical protein [Verrucomicrobiota bacterium]
MKTECKSEFVAANAWRTPLRYWRVRAMNPVATAASDYEAEGSGLLRASQLSAPTRTVAAVFKAVVPTAVQSLGLHPKTLNGTMPAEASHSGFMDRRTGWFTRETSASLRRRLRAVGLAVLCASASVIAAPTIELTVSLKPDHTQVAVPVEVDVTQALGKQSSAGGWKLEEVGTKTALPCQVSTEQGRALLRFIVPTKASTEPATRKFRLTKATRAAAPAFTLEDAEKKCLRLTEGEHPVLDYNYAMLLKDGVAEKYRRACYVHPIYDLDGVVLSDDFPKDHYHHRGLCWTWPHVKTPDMEKPLDLWALVGMGQKFHRFLGQEVGPVCARFGVSAGWYVAERKVVDETAWLTVYRADETGRAMDVELTLEATKEPVTIGGREKKGYGGFTLRFAPREETVLWTPNGKLPKDADHDHFPWADLSAKLAGAKAVSGAAIFDHAQNLGFPNTWCLRHYGVISPTYPGEGRHEIKLGQPLRLRYRVWIHRGDAQAGKVAAAYAAFARPPEVRVASK